MTQTYRQWNLRAAASLLTLLFSTFTLAAQGQSFEEFRKGILSDFDSFKNRILDQYEDFLAGEWHEYEALEATSKYSEPKPEAMPAVEMLDIEEATDQQKEMLQVMGFGNIGLLKPDLRKDPDLLQWLRSGQNLYNARAFQIARDQFANDNAETTPPNDDAAATALADIVTPDGLKSYYDGEIFNFYGMRFALPFADFSILPAISSTIEYAYHWNELEYQEVADKVIPGVKALQKASGISDYLVFEMLMAYLDAKFPDANDASKMSATHFILTHMGFGVRIAMDENQQPFMLIPFTEQIFGRAGLRLSKTFYVFSTPGREHVKRMGLSTPYLPDNAESGLSLNLRMEGLNLPYKPYHYAFEYEGLKIEGDMNENVIPMLYHYPQMDTGGFAATTISPDVRRDVVRQVKEQLGDQDPLRAADRLLAMIQFAFPYATDDNFHGFEKPYFFEESLYYPKSDCEDRAVFYSYLLWNALGLETDLIAYPYHEATAIKADKVWGGNAHYIDNDSKYFISDPTFQGAPTGQCMRKFNMVVPTIDLRYE